MEREERLNVTRRSESSVPRGANTRRGCQHGRGGVYVLHGAGARRCWRPVWREVMGAYGTPVLEYHGEAYYECDFGRGRGRLRQTRLSFGRTTRQSRTAPRERHQARGVG